MKAVPVLRIAVALLLLSGLASHSPRALAQAGLRADFDWSMPPRYGVDQRTMLTGEDRPDGLIDYMVTFPDAWNPDPEAETPIRPSSWQVDLNASASTGPIVSYHWIFAGEDLGETTARSITHHVPEEGTYPVTLTVADRSGNTASTTRNVVVQDWLIVAIGDSYASGEGNPEGEDWFADIVGAYTELAAAQEGLADALDALELAELDLELTAEELAPVLAALDRWNAECASPPDCAPQCAAVGSQCRSACAAAANTCRSPCRAAGDACRSLCPPGRLGDACRAACNQAQSACQSPCNAAETACRGTCDAAQTVCSSACLPSTACVDATADLVVALGQLGIGEAQDLIGEGYEEMLRQIDALQRVAEAAVEAAEAAVEAAESTVETIQGEIDQLYNENAVWQTIPDPESGEPSDRGCHRSSRSGQSLAALSIEESDPRTSVTFVHVACSGATIGRLKETQLPQVRDLVGDREIDALLVSIGGNDVGFACILAALGLNDPVCGAVRELARSNCQLVCEAEGTPPALCRLACDQVADSFEARCRESVEEKDPFDCPAGTAESLFADGLEKLRVDPMNPEKSTGYPSLQRALESQLPTLRPERVFTSEYPNLAEGDDGAVCPDYLTVSSASWRWIRDVMTTDLNAAIRDATQAYGWSYVGGIFTGFGGHGYCAEDHWVVRAEETFLIQGERSGVAHPNGAGHVLYGSRIASAVRASLYPGGAVRPPQEPGVDHASFRRGDTNADTAVDVSDAVFLLRFLFSGADALPCEDTADTNDSGTLDIVDAISLFDFLFLDGPAPVAPGPDACGSDPTEDVLECADYEPCS